MDSVKKTFSRWLRLALPLLAGASAAAGGTLWGGSLKVGGFGNEVQASQAVQPDLLRYQFWTEGQHRPVSAFADLESHAFQFQDALLKSAPNRRLSADGFRGRADDGQYRALVFKVGDEGNVNFSVLVSQGHSLAGGRQIQIYRIDGSIERDELSKDNCGLVSRFEGINHGPCLRFKFRVENSDLEFALTQSINEGSEQTIFHEIQCTATHFGLHGLQPGLLVNGGLPKGEEVRA
jgi:hypothetical protein